MKAKDARELKVGDWVKANFGNHVKLAEIVAIVWPKVKLEAVCTNGEVITRVRTYRSIWGKTDMHPYSLTSLPFWLKSD